MDSLTHLVAGACIGEIAAGKALGKRAMLFGALAQSIPDIDFIASFWLSPADNLLAHRGFTHSFLFMLLVTPLLAILLKRTHRKHDLTLKGWIFFIGIQVLFHLFIDAFNAYGTAWFEPFNHTRISFDALFVVDPLFSIWPFMAFIALLVMKRKNPKRKFLAKCGVIISLVYLGISVFNKLKIERDTRHFFETQSILPEKYFATPTPMNNLLWYIVAEMDSGFYIGYRSVFDQTKHIDLKYFTRNDQLLKELNTDDKVKKLRRFSQGYYTIEKWKDTLVFNDLRFGQIMGWSNPDARFVFHYFLKGSDENLLVIQRGRFRNWNWKTFNDLVRRMKGQ